MFDCCISLVQRVLAAPGYLPKWLFFISVVSIFNSVQCYVSGIKLTQKVYSKAPSKINSLSCRLFGTWTFVACIIRLYGSLFYYEEHIYQLTFISYVVALLHFGSELVLFRSCALDKGFMGPLIVSTTSLAWMYLQKEFYTGSSWWWVFWWIFVYSELLIVLCIYPLTKIYLTFKCCKSISSSGTSIFFLFFFFLIYQNMLS